MMKHYEGKMKALALLVDGSISKGLINRRSVIQTVVAMAEAI